jgi:DNA invertase Pin-like site-specific DNA recombinase
MLTTLSAFAQLDRAFIPARTKEGKERAKAQGRKFGRKPKLSRAQIAHARDLQSESEDYARLARWLAAMPQRFRALWRMMTIRR